MHYAFSIIIWDCAFREFFHALDSLARQSVDIEEYEVVAVEQRSRELSDSRNHRTGLPSLHDKYLQFKERLNIRLIYLDEPTSVPFHWGRTVNRAIRASRGAVISVLDADMLLPGDFLAALKEFHSAGQNGIANMFRHMADRPVGVAHNAWQSQDLSFERVLEECPTRGQAIPAVVTNKGPLISANRRLWLGVGGYDEHIIWSTGVSRIGQDVNTRMEILAGTRSAALRGCFGVHPWHPTGFRRDTLDSARLLQLQKALIDWTMEHGEGDWRKRTPFADELYMKRRTFLDRVINSHLADPGNSSGRMRLGQAKAMVEAIGTKLDSIAGRSYRRLNEFSERFFSPPRDGDEG